MLERNGKITLTFGMIPEMNDICFPRYTTVGELIKLLRFLSSDDDTPCYIYGDINHNGVIELTVGDNK